MILFSLFAILSIALNFARLLISLATLALPAWVALSVSFYTYKLGENILGAGLVGLTLGWLTYAAGLLAYAKARPVMFSRTIGFVYALPAGIAGYHLGLGLSHLIFTSFVLQQIFSITIATFIVIQCWRKITALALLPLGSLARADHDDHPSQLYCDNFTTHNQSSSSCYFIYESKYMSVTAAKKSSCNKNNILDLVAHGSDK